MPRILFLGDIVGRPGRDAVKARVHALRKERGFDLVVANAENAAAGAGLTAAIAAELREAGLDAMTLGDHVWDQRNFEAEIGGLERVCRPANLPDQCPGRTYLVVAAADGAKYQEKARATVLDGPVRALPALADGRLYARDGKRLVCWKLK